MRKYLLAILAIIAGTIIAAETAQPALDANGNIAKIFMPNIEDRFTIQTRSQILWPSLHSRDTSGHIRGHYRGPLRNAGIKVGPVFLLHLGSSFQIELSGTGGVRCGPRCLQLC